MGLYITILSKEKCPECGAKINEWQSKNVIDKLGYDLEMYQGVKVEDIKEGRMYADCEKCKSWIDYRIVDGKLTELNIQERGE